MAKAEQFSPEAILAGLALHSEATAAELAERIGIGKSTATRYLAALEAEGKARRTPGGWNDGRRFADRWSVTPTESEAPSPGTPSPPPAPPITLATAAAPRVAAADPKSSAPTPGASGDRLAPGGLGALVLAYLAARPGESFGPSAVGKALGRSGGAVSNALAAMAVRGQVTQVGDKPRRYQIAARK
jgi:DNA-binding MarR family transcriptional regulator